MHLEHRTLASTLLQEVCTEKGQTDTTTDRRKDTHTYTFIAQMGTHLMGEKWGKNKLQEKVVGENFEE